MLRDMVMDVHEEFKSCVHEAVSNLKSKVEASAGGREKEYRELARIKYEVAQGYDRIEQAQRKASLKTKHKRYSK